MAILLGARVLAESPEAQPGSSPGTVSAEGPPGFRRLAAEGDRLWGGNAQDPRESGTLPDGEEHEWALPVPGDLGTVPDFVRSRLLGREVPIGQVEDFVRFDLDGREHRLSALLMGKDGRPVPVLALHWFAEWCSNCNFEAPYLVELHSRFGARGLTIVGMAEYSHPVKLREYIARHSIPFLVLQGTPNAQDPDIRFITDHYRYRRSVGDQRKWGTPFTVLIERGDTRHVTVIAGEARRRPIEAFLEAALDPPSGAPSPAP